MDEVGILRTELRDLQKLYESAAVRHAVEIAALQEMGDAVQMAHQHALQQNHLHAMGALRQTIASLTAQLVVAKQVVPEGFVFTIRENEMLKSQTTQLSSDRANLEFTVAELTESVAMLTVASENSATTVTQLQVDMARLQHALQGLRETNHHLKGEVEILPELQTTVSQLRELVQSLEEDNARLSSEAAELRAAKAESDAIIAGEVGRLKEAKRGLAKKMKEQFEAARSGFREQQAKLESDLKEVSFELARAKEDQVKALKAQKKTAALKTEIVGLQAALDAARKETTTTQAYAELDGAHTRLRGMYEDAVIRNGGLVEIAKVAEKEAWKQRGMVSDLEKDNREQRKTIATLMQTGAESLKKNEAGTKLINTMKEREIAIEKRARSAEQRIAKAELRILMLESQLAETRKAVEAQSVRADWGCSRAAELEGEKAGLLKERDAFLAHRNGELEAENSALMTVISTMRTHINDLHAAKNGAPGPSSQMDDASRQSAKALLSVIMDNGNPNAISRVLLGGPQPTKKHDSGKNKPPSVRE